MFDLPLFPLGSVLFPGIPISLHIFEERYKEMINLCLENSRPFGVVLIRDGREAHGPLAQPHLIGCTALITGVKPLEQGRKFIVAVGVDRFRINSLSFDQPYLVGAVELLPQPDQSDTLQAQRHGEQLDQLVRRYLEIVTQAGGLDFEPEQIPTDPLQLAYWSAAILQNVPQTQKQDLLALESTRALLAQVSALYRREVNFLEMMLAQHSAGEEASPFSLN
jgi:Lon protease-like protein